MPPSRRRVADVASLLIIISFFWAYASASYGAEPSDMLIRIKTLHAAQRYVEGHALSKEYLELVRERGGPENPNYALGLGWLGKFEFAFGRYSAAEELYRRAIVIQERTLPNDHREIADTLSHLA